MIPTAASCKLDALEYLDDTAGSRFAASVQTWGFEKAYYKLIECLQLYQLPKLERVVTYSLAANTTSLTPATASIADFGELILIEERLDGSTERYTKVDETDRLPQVDPSSILAEFEWRDDTFYFLGATTARQLRIRYTASGTAPTGSASVGVDGSLLVLGKLSAAYMAPRKGDPELGRDLMKQALGPRFEEGVIGGDMLNLLLPMSRARQAVPVAPRPFRAGYNRRSSRARGQFFVAAPPTTETMIYLTITGTISGTDGTDGNAVFALSPTPTNGILSLRLYNNGFLMYPVTDYNLASATVTFVSGRIPVVGDNLLATDS